MTSRQVQVLIGLGTAVVLLLAALIVLLVLRNDDGGSAATTAATSTSLEATSTTTATTAATTTTAAPTTSSSTTSSSTTTSTTAAVACPGPGAGPLPVGSTIAVDVVGDFDDDGAADRFLVYEDGGGTYWARVDLSYGYSSVAADPQPGPGVINAKAVDLGGGGDLAIAESLASPSSRLATFYYLHGCQLDAAALSGGGIAQFPLGGGAMARAGITCNADGITVTEAEVTGDMSGADWEYGAVEYLWVPGLGEFQGSLGLAVILHSPADDDAIAAAGDWNC